MASLLAHLLTYHWQFYLVRTLDRTGFEKRLNLAVKGSEK